MAARAALLILAALLAFRAVAASAGELPACASCHAGRHYARLGTCVGCHRGDPTTGRRSIAHARLLRGAAAAWSIPGAPPVRAGERLRERLGCRRCHVSGDRGNALALSLDASVWRRDQEALREAIVHPATFMPDFGLSLEQADRLIAVLLRDGDRAARQERYLVRFRDASTPKGNPFATRCGPCHRALTPVGPLGRGSAGPNLSGLLTAHYPSADGRAWDRARLERWVRNPRAERAGATMAPIDLPRDEMDAIERLLGGTPAAAARPDGTR